MWGTSDVRNRWFLSHLVGRCPVCCILLPHGNWHFYGGLCCYLRMFTSNTVLLRNSMCMPLSPLFRASRTPVDVAL
jgi:hypothetical protein